MSELVSSEVYRNVSLGSMTEHLPGDVVIALNNLQWRCRDHQMDMAVCAFFKLVDNAAIQVIILWPPVTEQNAELKEMVRDALSRD